ncbi:MAG TPA: DUF2723 domain-containing protein, partial [Kofleriaceae bacterium]|nr:DUF2723 domain-containing protein [Kofleriaceae bacterium]
LGLLVLGAYVWLAPRHVVDGDNAEFSTLGSLGGVPHPTGYPLFMIWLRLMQWLPGANAAHTAALATAILGAASIMMLHAACRAWGARPAAATLACALFAAAPVVVELNTEAEVFALNNLVAATILWLAAIGGPVRGLWRAGLLGLVAGLGLCDHVTCAMLAPIGILGVVRGAREARTVPAVALAAAGMVIGLLPYAYLLITAENARSWGRHIDSFHALMFHFLRKDYGGPGAFAPNRPPVPMGENLAELARTLARWWLWLPLIAGLIVLGKRISRTHEGETRVAWAMLAVTWLICGPLLVLRFNVELQGVGLFVVHRFHLLAALLLAVPIAVAFSDVGTWIAPRVPKLVPLVDVLALVLFVGVLASSLPFVQGVHSPAVERNARNMLASLPEHAVVVVAEDDLDFASSYVQLVLGERRDVTVVMWYAVARPATRERIEHDLGFAIPKVGEDIFVAHFADAVLASGRPMFVDGYQKHVLEAFPTYPYGILFRVLPKGSPRPSIRDVFAINRDLYAKFQFGYAIPRRDAPWPMHVHERLAEPWQIIHDALVVDGDPDDAAFALELGRSLLPR